MGYVPWYFYRYLLEYLQGIFIQKNHEPLLLGIVIAENIAVQIKKHPSRVTLTRRHYIRVDMCKFDFSKTSENNIAPYHVDILRHQQNWGKPQSDRYECCIRSSAVQYMLVLDLKTQIINYLSTRLLYYEKHFFPKNGA